MVLSQENQRIANDWKERLFYENGLMPINEQVIAPGEAGGFLVSLDGSSLSAYLKPTERSNHSEHPRAANEKIAADIATHLGLPVPPVLLYRRENCPAEHDSCACISLVMHPEHFEMHLLKHGQKELLATVQKIAFESSGIIAFDAYIGHQDRSMNARNVIFGYNQVLPKHNCLLFLDHSNSMNINNRWSSKGWRIIEEPPVYELFNNCISLEQVLDVACKIENMDEGFLRHTITRIPDSYMPQPHKEILLEGLIGRRKLIKEVLVRRFG